MLTVPVQDENAAVQRIGIADGAVVSRPNRLRTSGLGSCVGLVVFDLQSGVAGMVHVMLPVAPPHSSGRDLNKPQKYADSGVRWLVGELQGLGVSVRQLRAKMAGGAQMFASLSASDILRVGPRNVEAVHEQLQFHRIPVVSQDVGGTEGRTIEFDSQTQTLMVRTAKSGMVYI